MLCELAFMRPPAKYELPDKTPPATEVIPPVTELYMSPCSLPPVLPCCCKSCGFKAGTLHLQVLNFGPSTEPEQRRQVRRIAEGKRPESSSSACNSGRRLPASLLFDAEEEVVPENMEDNRPKEEEEDDDAAGCECVGDTIGLDGASRGDSIENAPLKNDDDDCELPAAVVAVPVGAMEASGFKSASGSRNSDSSPRLPNF